MAVNIQCFSPVLKQCFVTCGVSLNMAAGGIILAYGTPLLVQLKSPESAIPIDDLSGSWIASVPAMTMFVGNFLAIPIMEKCGRRTMGLISIFLCIVTWICISFTSELIFLVFARVFQGISLGMSTAVSSILIGEYSSPKNRGVFLLTISISIAFGVLATHVAGSFLTWRTCALICAIIAALDFLIVLFSPESPSWLASRGKYDESMKVFRWLRGNSEEDELKKIITTSMAIRESNVNTTESTSIPIRVKAKWNYFGRALRLKELYKPIIIMIHLFTLSSWSGVNFITVYGEDFILKTVSHCNVPFVVMTLDIHRLVINTLSIFIVKKLRRRILMFISIGLNIIAQLSIAAYTYAKSKGAIYFDHPMIGIILLHFMIFTIASGTLNFPFIIAGEIFPLEFKNIAGGITVIFYSITLFLSIKTIPYCITNFGVYGACCINTVVVAYCLAVAGILLPETKDRILQDIEDEFRGRSLIPKNSEEKSVVTKLMAPLSMSNCNDKTEHIQE